MTTTHDDDLTPEGPIPLILTKKQHALLTSTIGHIEPWDDLLPAAKKLPDDPSYVVLDLTMDDLDALWETVSMAQDVVSASKANRLEGVLGAVGVAMDGF